MQKSPKHGSVELVSFTGKYSNQAAVTAAAILMYTKKTRTEENHWSLDEYIQWVFDEMPGTKIKEELGKIASTIESSWEFIDLTFEIRGLTRATAQQVTRTRTASYAMESQRVVSPQGVKNPFEEDHPAWQEFEDAKAMVIAFYGSILGYCDGDKTAARGILPMNTECRLMAKYNLREWIHLVRARKSLRTANEYALLVDDMIACVKDVYWWIDIFLTSPYDRAIELLEEMAKEEGITTGSGRGWELAKVVDLLRKS